MTLSRYTYLFEREGTNLLYSSRSNNFYKIPSDFADLLSRIDEVDEAALPEDEREAINALRDAMVIV